jgi:hypothetical protein
MLRKATVSIAAFVVLFSLTEIAHGQTATSVAQRLGLPSSATPNVTAPAAGPNGTLVYLNRKGLVTALQPATATAYFGSAKGIVFVVNTQGYFVVRNGKPVQLRQGPRALSHFPHARRVARAISHYAKRVAKNSRKVATRPSSKGNASLYRSMSKMNQMMHNTNMNIINNIGGAGCTRHYENNAYVGCW